MIPLISTGLVRIVCVCVFFLIPGTLLFNCWLTSVRMLQEGGIVVPFMVNAEVWHVGGIV